MSIDLHKKLIYIDYSGITDISSAIGRHTDFTFYPLAYDFTTNTESLVYSNLIEYVFRK